MKFNTKKLLKMAAVVAVLTLGFGSGLALASVPDSSGTIQSCYTTSSGALRVIDPSSGGSCHSYETSLSWSQSGQSVKTFSGTDTVLGSSGTGTLTESCSDSGIPLSLWFNGRNVMSINGAGSSATETLVYPNGDSTKAPIGIQVTSNTLQPNTSGSYTLICS